MKNSRGLIYDVAFVIINQFPLRQIPPMSTVTKLDLTQSIVDGIGLTSREAKEMVEAFFDEISACLEAGGEVKITGFGKFQLRDKSQRPGRNPKTGETFAVTARRVVAFHPSAKLKDAIDETRAA